MASYIISKYIQKIPACDRVKYIEKIHSLKLPYDPFTKNINTLSPEHSKLPTITFPDLCTSLISFPDPTYTADILYNR